MLRIEDLGKMVNGEWVVQYSNGYSVKIEPTEHEDKFRAFIFNDVNIDVYYPSIEKEKLEMVLYSVGGL